MEGEESNFKGDVLFSRGLQLFGVLMSTLAEEFVKEAAEELRKQGKEELAQKLEEVWKSYEKRVMEFLEKEGELEKVLEELFSVLEKAEEKEGEE